MDEEQLQLLHNLYVQAGGKSLVNYNDFYRVYNEEPNNFAATLNHYGIGVDGSKKKSTQGAQNIQSIPPPQSSPRQSVSGQITPVTPSQNGESGSASIFSDGASLSEYPQLQQNIQNLRRSLSTQAQPALREYRPTTEEISGVRFQQNQNENPEVKQLLENIRVQQVTDTYNNALSSQASQKTSKEMVPQILLPGYQRTLTGEVVNTNPSVIDSNISTTNFGNELIQRAKSENVNITDKDIDIRDFNNWLLQTGRAEQYDDTFFKSRLYFRGANPFTQDQGRIYSVFNEYYNSRLQTLSDDVNILNARLKVARNNGQETGYIQQQINELSVEMDNLVKQNKNIYNKFDKLKAKDDQRINIAEQREKVRANIASGSTNVRDYATYGGILTADLWNTTARTFGNLTSGFAQIASGLAQLPTKNENVLSKTLDEFSQFASDNFVSGTSFNQDTPQLEYTTKNVEYNGEPYSIRIEDGYIFDKDNNIVRDDALIQNILRQNPISTEQRYDIMGVTSGVYEQLANLYLASRVGGTKPVGVATGYFVQSFAQNYNEAKAAGIENDGDAYLTATALSASDGLMELFVDKIRLAGAGRVPHSWLLNKIGNRPTRDKIQTAFKETLKDYTSSIAIENGTEIATNYAQSAIMTAANYYAGANFDTEVTAKDTEHTILLTTLFTGGLGLGGLKQRYNYAKNINYQTALVTASRDPQFIREFEQVVQTPELKTSLEQQFGVNMDNTLRDLKTLNQIGERLPNNLSSSQYLDIVPLFQERENLEREKTRTDPAFKNVISQIDTQINQINDRINEISTTNPYQYEANGQDAEGAQSSAESTSQTTVEEPTQNTQQSTQRVNRQPQAVVNNLTEQNITEPDIPLTLSEASAFTPTVEPTNTGEVSTAVNYNNAEAIQQLTTQIQRGITSINEQLENARYTLDNYINVYGENSTQANRQRQWIEDINNLRNTQNQSIVSNNNRYRISLDPEGRLQIQENNGRIAQLSPATQTNYFIEAIQKGIYNDVAPVSQSILENAQSQEQIPDIIARESNSPVEIAETMEQVPKYLQDDNIDYKEGAIADMIPESFYSSNNRNNVNLSNNGRSLDTLAREISEMYYGDTDSVTPQDIAAFMVDNPTGWRRPVNPQYRALTNRFVEITGINPTPRVLNAFTQNVNNVENTPATNEQNSNAANRNTEPTNVQNVENQQNVSNNVISEPQNTFVDEQNTDQNIDEDSEDFFPFQQSDQTFTRITAEQRTQLLATLNRAFPNVAVNFFNNQNVNDILGANAIEVQNLTDRNNTIYGFVRAGQIYLNENTFNANTPIHEYSHIWTSIAQIENPDLYNTLIKQAKNTPEFLELQQSEIYGNLTDNQIAEEAIATAIGNRGEQLYQQQTENTGIVQSIYNTISNIADRLMNYIKSRLGIASPNVLNWNNAQLYNATFSDIVNNIASDLLNANVVSEVSTADINNFQTQNNTSDNTMQRELSEADIRFQISEQQDNLNDLVNDSEYDPTRVRGVVQRIKQLNIQAQSFLRRRILNGLKAGAGLPKQVSETIRYLQREYNVITDNINFELKEIYNTIERDIVRTNTGSKQQRKLQTDAKKRLVNQYMSGENVDVSFLSEDSMSVLSGLRSRIDNISMEIIDVINNRIETNRARLENYHNTSLVYHSIAEAIERQENLVKVIQDNKTKYLHRSYEIFLNPDYVKQQKFYDTSGKLYANNKLVKDAVEYLMAEEGQTQTEAYRTIDELLKEGMNDQGNAFTFAASQGNARTNIFKHRKDIPVAIRELLGEIQDPALNYGNTIFNMSTYLANINYQENLKQSLLDSGLATEEKKVGYYQYKPSTANWSGLQNIYIPNSVRDAIEDMGGIDMGKNSFIKLFAQLGGFVKYGKTVLSPTTIARNTISGIFLAFNAGYNIFLSGPSQVSNYFRITLNYNSSRGEYRDMLIREGIIKDGASFGELQDLKRNFSRNINQYNPNSRNWIRRLSDFSQKIYAFGDDFYKLAGFEIETERLKKYGIPQEQAYKMAAERIRNTMPTYSYVPRLVRTIGRSGLIGSFVSFPAEVIRTNKNNLDYIRQDIEAGRNLLAFQRGAGMVTAWSLSLALAAATRALFGIDDEDDDSIKDALPEWQTNSSLAYIGLQENGMPKFIDLSAFFPNEVVIKPMRALIDGRESRTWQDQFMESAREWLDPYFGIDLTTDALIQFVSNTTDTGGSIYKGNGWTDLLTAQNGKSEYLNTADWVARKLAPGAYNNIREFALANVDEVRDLAKTNPYFKPIQYVVDDVLEMGQSTSPSGKVYNNTDALMALFGFRTSTLNLETSVYYQSLQAKDQLSSVKTALNARLRQNRQYTDEQITDLIVQAQERQNQIYREEYKKINSFRRLGITNEKLMQALAHSKNNNALLIRGYIPQFSEASVVVGSRNGNAVVRRTRKTQPLITPQSEKLTINSINQAYSNNKPIRDAYLSNYRRNVKRANQIARKIYKPVQVEQ